MSHGAGHVLIAVAKEVGEKIAPASSEVGACGRRQASVCALPCRIGTCAHCRALGTVLLGTVLLELC